MPSPRAPDQHHNQLNRNEREMGRQRNKEWEPKRKTQTERGRKQRREECYLQQTFIKTQSPANTPTGHWSGLFLPLWLVHSEKKKGLWQTENTDREVSLVLIWMMKEIIWCCWCDIHRTTNWADIAELPQTFTDPVACQIHCFCCGSWQQKEETRELVCKTFSLCQKPHLIENCKKTQNHIFHNHSATSALFFVISVELPEQIMLLIQCWWLVLVFSDVWMQMGKEICVKLA